MIFYDACKTISLANLSRNGYLKAGIKQGILTWQKENSSIKICVNMQSETPYLELNYVCKGKQVNYRVSLLSKPSNLGRGIRWYFVCPRTGRRCEKLYYADGLFLHRKAFRGMYKVQALSKRWRALMLPVERTLKGHKLLEKFNGGYFKARYMGKITRTYAKMFRFVKRNSNTFLNNLGRFSFNALQFEKTTPFCQKTPTVKTAMNYKL